MIPLIIYMYLFFQLVFIAYVDIKIRKVSNFWILFNSIIFIFATFMYPKIYHFSWEIFYYPAAFVFVGFALFALKIMGAGDSKYLSSLFLLVPIEWQDYVFIHLVYFTIFTGGVLLLLNTVNNLNKLKSALVLKDMRLIKSIYGKKFAYTPVIFVTWLWFGVTHWKLI